MSPALSVTSQTPEEFWRLRVEEARAHYHKAQERYGRLLDKQPHGTPHDANGAVTLAHQAEAKALAEYARVLGIFADLIVNGKTLEEQPAAVDWTAHEFRFRQNFYR